MNKRLTSLIDLPELASDEVAVLRVNGSIRLVTYANQLGGLCDDCSEFSAYEDKVVLVKIFKYSAGKWYALN